MRITRALAAALACAVLAAGCTPSVPASSPTATPTPSPTALPARDLTQPGVARTTIRDLVAASSSTQVLMVSVRRYEARVSVLLDGTPRTWAYRDGAIEPVRSDLEYVDQATFDPNNFDLSDVGALFRAASAVSGSDEAQELQIIDLHRVEHNAAEIPMSVATNPETRTVFFRADGTLVPTLGFNTASGIAQGLVDAVGTHTIATAVSVSSASGAEIDFLGADGTTVRRMRASKIPVTDVPRSGGARLPPFDPRAVSPAVIWRVLQRYAAAGDFSPTTVWSVAADASGPGAVVRLRFSIGNIRVVTDLEGNEVTQ